VTIFRQTMAEKNWGKYVMFILVKNFKFDEILFHFKILAGYKNMTDR